MQTLERLRANPAFMANVAAWERLPARPARTAAWPASLTPPLRAALHARGLDALYTHQVQACAAAQRGEHVVVVTGTASGKTLCYNLPVLHTILADPSARALYLFPTKALAQDQLAALENLTAALGPGPAAVSVQVYDGDTPVARRPQIRKAAGVLISNPDMLHTGILPHHTQWADWLANLRFVVLDELHTYRGLFGSHLANVLRRLKRLCAFYGARPQFICTSATIANPRELAEKLIEAPVTLVDDDGSPRAEKHVIIYNPPLLDPVTGLRRSYLLETQKVAGEFLADGVQTAVFARTRNATEVLLGYVRDELRHRRDLAAEDGGPAPAEAAAVRGYRGGYLPVERREIEAGLRDGAVSGVVATNALELGVDIGQLGAVIVAGYPGTLASLWQQAGRAGRRTETSAVVFVASAAPLDQYLALHPRYVFEHSPERALVNPDHLGLLADHLRCAVFELPFKTGEPFGAFADVESVLQALAEEGEVHLSNSAYRWVADSYPAQAVSLRSASGERIVIQEAGSGRPVVIGEVDRSTAPLRVHEGAVYLHEGRSFVISRLNWEDGIAEAHAEEVDYFTEAAESVDIDLLRTVAHTARPTCEHAWGHLLITSQPVSYRQIKRYTHETIGHGVITLPAREFQTTGYWLSIPTEMVQRLAAEGILIAPNDYGPNWEQQRQVARARDGYRCRQCGAPEAVAAGGDGGGRRQHDVHHLVPFRAFGYVPGLNDAYQQANRLDNLITLCRVCHTRTEMARGTQTALGGLAHALGNVAPLFLMCDPRDIGCVSDQRSKITGGPAITLFDQVPEGVGFAEELYAQQDELLRSALELVQACPCREGCPACVGPVGLEAAETKDLTRKLAERLLQQRGRI
jgi:DEAD/DEAH box helicase domain-containing protein